MVYPFACALRPNHYKIAHAERTIEVGVLMKAKTWAVSLHVSLGYGDRVQQLRWGGGMDDPFYHCLSPDSDSSLGYHQ
jgi:hypothetical protein